MDAAFTRVSSTHTYSHNGVETAFSIEDNGSLSVTIDTDRLHLQSLDATERVHSCYAALFGDGAVMEKYGSGVPLAREQIQGRIDNTWVRRWREKDPFSGLAVYNKETDEFLGHVVLGHGDAPGQSELAYLFMRQHWGKRIGTEAVSAVVNEYAPATVREGYFLEGKPLEEVTATSRSDNPASIRILQTLGMKKIGEVEKLGALRESFSINLRDIEATRK